MIHTNNAKGALIVATAALMYFFEFYLRVIPNSINHEIMQAFSLNAETFGIMSAMFFYGYCPLQVPAGKLGDKIGPRKVLIAAMIICTMCVFAFAFPSHRYLLYISRFGVGAASAFAYIGPIMLAKMWLDKKYIASTVGLIQTLGCRRGNSQWQTSTILSTKFWLATSDDYQRNHFISNHHAFCIILEEKPKTLFKKTLMVIKSYHKNHKHGT